MVCTIGRTPHKKWEIQTRYARESLQRRVGTTPWKWSEWNHNGCFMKFRQLVDAKTKLSRSTSCGDGWTRHEIHPFHFYNHKSRSSLPFGDCIGRSHRILCSADPFRILFRSLPPFETQPTKESNNLAFGGKTKRNSKFTSIQPNSIDIEFILVGLSVETRTRTLSHRIAKLEHIKHGHGGSSVFCGSPFEALSETETFSFGHERCSVSFLLNKHRQQQQ